MKVKTFENDSNENMEKSTAKSINMQMNGELKTN
jgi:hypothetical protein